MTARRGRLLIGRTGREIWCFCQPGRARLGTSYKDRA